MMKRNNNFAGRWNCRVDAKEEVRMNNKYWRAVSATLLSVLALCYVGYHILNGSRNTFNTEIAVVTDYAQDVTVNGWIVRSEQTLVNNNKGYLSYVVEEGEKMAKNGVVAHIYAAENSITISKELALVRAQIANLQSLNSEVLAGTRPATINKKISDQMSAMMLTMVNGDLNAMTEEREKLLLYIHQKQIVTGELSDFSERIQELRKQEKALQDQYRAPVNTLTTKVSGYFSSVADGYEQVLTADSLKNITVEALRNVQPDVLQENVVGKVVQSNVWYAACIFPMEQARLLKVGDTITLTLPDTDIRTEVKVEDKYFRNAWDTEAVVVLRGENMTGDIAAARGGEMKLSLHNYTGFKINRNAIHIVKRNQTVTDADGNKVTKEVEVYGVYVIFGEQLRFREISPLYWDEEFVICSANAKSTTDATMLKQYDQVILGGKDLYDGKPIN
jgi:hypothetical protein